MDLEAIYQALEVPIPLRGQQMSKARLDHMNTMYSNPLGVCGSVLTPTSPTTSKNTGDPQPIFNSALWQGQRTELCSRYEQNENLAK